MKLYNVPRESFVKVLEDVHVPPGAPAIKKGDIVFFDHIDGMYSFCFDKTKTQVLHLAAFTEVELIENEE